MPVAIVQVMNNTSLNLFYHNTQTGLQFSIAAKTATEPNNEIPAKHFIDDPLPYSTAGSIELWLGTTGPRPKVNISDEDWKFRIESPVPLTTDRVAKKYGNLNNGWKYMLRIDEVKEGGKSVAGLTILKYEDQFQVSAGYIALATLELAAPIIGMVLICIFL